MQRDTVHVTLHQNGEGLAPYAVSGHVQSIKNPAFGVDGRLGRIQILWLPFAEDPSAESHDLPRFVANGKHDTTAKTIVRAARVAKLHQSALDEHLGREVPIEPAHQI